MPVVKALRDDGIDVNALHSHVLDDEPRVHMLDDEPRVSFMHFWGNDDARKLARGLRVGLDHVNVAKG